jgi:hypothetical protein
MGLVRGALAALISGLGLLGRVGFVVSSCVQDIAPFLVYAVRRNCNKPLPIHRLIGGSHLE